jgi:hypothetical protein
MVIVKVEVPHIGGRIREQPLMQLKLLGHHIQLVNIRKNIGRALVVPMVGKGHIKLLMNRKLLHLYRIHAGQLLNQVEVKTRPLENRAVGSQRCVVRFNRLDQEDVVAMHIQVHAVLIEPIEELDQLDGLHFTLGRFGDSKYGRTHIQLSFMGQRMVVLDVVDHNDQAALVRRRSAVHAPGVLRFEVVILGEVERMWRRLLVQRQLGVVVVVLAVFHLVQGGHVQTVADLEYADVQGEGDGNVGDFFEAKKGWNAWNDGNNFSLLLF